jgi:hypothetical protein
MEPIRFKGQIRFWNPDKPGGLAVVDLPGELIPAFGGLKQQRVHGSIEAVEFTRTSCWQAPAGWRCVSKADGRHRHQRGAEVAIEVTGIGTAP